MARDIPTVSTSYHKFLSTAISPQTNRFYLTNTTPEEIEEIIENLNSNKATGPYSIPIKMMKLLKLLINVPLNLLFNCSFETGVVLDTLKISRVIPIYKTGSRLDMCNYRPISLEKRLYNRLILYLEKFKILNEKSIWI